MASRQGTLLTAPVRIQDDQIPQPVAYANEVSGGAQSGPTLLSRDQVALWNRQWGMFFTVYNDTGNNGTYYLKYSKVSTNLSDNGNWELFAGAGGSNANKKIDQSILTTGSINIPANCLLMALMINAAADFAAIKIGWTSGNDDIVLTQPAQTGFNVFPKGLWIPQPVTIYFSGIEQQSTCSALIIPF